MPDSGARRRGPALSWGDATCFERGPCKSAQRASHTRGHMGVRRSGGPLILFYLRLVDWALQRVPVSEAPTHSTKPPAAIGRSQRKRGREAPLGQFTQRDRSPRGMKEKRASVPRGVIRSGPEGSRWPPARPSCLTMGKTAAPGASRQRHALRPRGHLRRRAPSRALCDRRLPMMTQLLGFVVLPAAIAGLGWSAALAHVRSVRRSSSGGD